VRAFCERARGDRAALVLFAGEARLAVPLTRDQRSLADLADAADPASVARGGTDLAAALAAAGDALKVGDAGPAGRRPAVVLLTDGDDLAGRGERAAATLWARGVAVHAVGFGTALGGKIPEEGGAGWVASPAGGDVVVTLDGAGLRRVAAAGGGEAVEAADSGDAPASLRRRGIAEPAAPRARDAKGPSDGAVRAALLAALLLGGVDLAASRRGPRGARRGRR
jgi:Ca-activated chloride channel family protein